LSTKIHPTAIIEKGAKLDHDVTIGPFAYIGPRVQLGAQSIVHHHATIEGKSIIGEKCQIYPYALIGGMTQDLKYKNGTPGLLIGDRNIFREYVTVHIATHQDHYTRIGNDNLILAYSHIAHDCQIGDFLVMSSNAALAGHVHLGNHVNIAWNTGIHQFCHIGSYTMIGGCSKVVQDVPHYMTADGRPAKVKNINKIGLQRAGFSSDDIQIAHYAYKLFYREGLNRSQALEQMRSYKQNNSPIIKNIINFIEQSERGLA
jgi:UDP-N-acetylglucosamine acyltransferase